MSTTSFPQYAKTSRYQDLVEAASCRITGQIDHSTVGYVTEGGTYILASSPSWSDDGRPRDLVAILPVALGESRVLVLRPTVHPDLVAELRAALDGERA